MNLHPKKIFIAFISISLVICANKLQAQQGIEQLGNYLSFKKIPNGVSITTTNASIHIIAYSSNIIRVRASKDSIKEEMSYAVISEPKGNISEVNETDTTVIFSTDSLFIQVEKKPLRINFYKKSNNQLLTGDDETLGIVWAGTEVTNYRKLSKEEKIIGLGQKTGDINHIGQVLVNYNVDAPGFKPDTDPLYSTMPFYMGIHDSLTYGIFFDNTYKSTFDFNLAGTGQYYSFGAEGGEMNYYFFGASSIAGIISDYTSLTGRMTMPPMWGLGYIQSRYSYMSENSLLEVANKFRETHIPCDGIFCDIDYMDHFKVFTWNRDSFPDTKGMVDSLKKIGFHLYVILDPALKIEKGYKLYDEGVAGNHFARYPNGKLFTGSVWAGASHLTDFINPDTRKWWEDNLKFYTNDGITGFLNDMDEPSFLVKITPNAIQFGNKNNSLAYKQVHNVFGMQMARSTYEGIKDQTGLRPFNITRSAYSGIQRYASMWTGDNQATDMHMMMDIRMCLSMNLTGLSYVGMNVGGFVGNPTPELMERWMQIGAYMPLFINHYINRNNNNEKNLQPHEPYAFDAPVRDELRKSIRYRYALLPYLYSAFYQASKNGIPILKALPYSYSFDKIVYETKYQEEFLCGDHILVAPVVSTADSAQIYLPEGVWYRNSTEEAMEGGKEINVAAPMNDLPVFIKAGAIIPMQTPVEYTSQKGDGILELNIWFGKNKNNFTYYEDDGSTFKYQDGSYYTRNISWDPQEKVIKLNKKEGDFVSKFQQVKLIFHKFSGLKNYIMVNGKKVTLTENNNNEEAMTNNIDGIISINLN